MSRPEMSGVQKRTAPVPFILIVDDSAEARELYTVCFELHGWKVMSAENGRAGIDLAAKCGPDAILLDFSMPGMDGAEVLRLLKSDARTSAIPVVMLTAVPELAWGAVGSASSAFLEKPCDPETLVQTMLRVVRPRPGPAEARATRRTNRHG